ncbi:hypothetical protein CL614_02400 [archaeon]|nr:hypothetical protein [archaeon]
MDDEKITLDKKAFQSLASDSRISILKSLDKRRKTLSELSKESKMSVSTVSEHIGKLTDAGLIVKKDDGHKWKYYELSRKGKGVLYPETKKIWVIISVSILAILAFGSDLFFRSSFAAASATKDSSEMILSEGTRSTTPQVINVVTGLPLIHIIGITFFAILALVSLTLLYRKGMILKK